MLYVHHRWKMSRSNSNNFNNGGSGCFTSEESIDELLQKTQRLSATSGTRKAKRVRFYHNGNKFFNGIVIPISADRYRTFESLTNELTTLLNKAKNVTLTAGVRIIYTLDGRKISKIDDFEDGKEYVCASGKTDTFKKLEYKKIDEQQRPKLRQNLALNNKSMKLSYPDYVRPRIVTIIRNGLKPRKIVRLLLNKRNACSLEQCLSALTDVARLDSGAVRKVFTMDGTLVTSLEEFFKEQEVFFVYGNERYQQDDFELEFEESKQIQMMKRTSVRKIGGPKPKMPKKEINHTFESLKHKDKLNKDDDLQLPADLKAKYTIGDWIGDGNFAVVRLCKEKQTGDEFAMKIIDKLKCKGKEDMVENEVQILKRVDHPNIMRYIAQQDTPSLLFLIVEYVNGGDLFDAIIDAQKYSEKQAALMINHLASALAYLHNLNIVHRDVKPENLFVTYDGDKQIRTLKLGDFGLACEVNDDLYTVCGTPTYVAPEILAESGYGLKIDVWAAGVIMYILLCGYPPFVSQDNDQEQLFDSILSGQYDFPDEYWGDISEPAKELIQNMLQLAPDIRFSAEDVLDHQWLQQYS